MAMLGDVGLIHVLPLAVHLFFWAEQVEGVSLSHFYSLGLLLETSIILKSCGVGGVLWVAHKILETAQSPNFFFPFLFDFWLGLLAWTWACQ